MRIRGFVVILLGSLATGVMQGCTTLPEPAQVTKPSRVHGSTLLAHNSTWWSSVRDSIQRAEYQINPVERQSGKQLRRVPQAPNRAQGFRTYFESGGIVVEPRVDSGRRWTLRMRLGVSDGPSSRRRLDVAPEVAGNRAEYQHGSLLEWFINGPKGLEHGFDIPRPLPSADASEPLSLEIAVTGSVSPKAGADGSSAMFVDGSGAPVLRYGEARAVDAAGRELPVTLTVRSQALALSVDTRKAEYPVRIDPVLTADDAWRLESGEGVAGLGITANGAGDVNGDGFSDVVVGVQSYDVGRPLAGKTMVFHGSSGGLTTASWEGQGEAARALFGASVATAGDVDGDGIGDLIIGAPGANGRRGEVYVYCGGPEGIVDERRWRARYVGRIGPPTMEGSESVHSVHFGASVGSAGDVNGDGRADVVVGAPAYTALVGAERGATPRWREAAGLAAVFLGRPSCMLGGDVTQDAAIWTVHGDGAGERLGSAVATAGDVNGDGRADVIVAVPGDRREARTSEPLPGAPTGSAHVYLGRAVRPLSGDPIIVVSDATDTPFATSIAGAGDIDGDGFADVIVGARDGDGSVSVYHGAPEFPRVDGAPKLVTGATYSGPQGAEAHFGQSVSSAGDVNGDGYADVIVGADRFDDGDDADAGAAYLYLGGPDGLRPDAVDEDGNAEEFATGLRARGYFGYHVALAGDVDGDGYSDVIVSSPPGPGAWDASVDAVFAYTGRSRVDVDVDVDGMDLSRFSMRATAAGDVDGDGYGDVVVTDSDGSVALHSGSAAGLASQPAWSLSGLASDWPDAPGSGEHLAEVLGARKFAAAAGDLDGDGFDDLVVGAPGPGNWGGTLYPVFARIFFGSAEGLGFAPYLDIKGLDVNFGYSVASAGDIDADGFSDLLVGAPGYYEPGFQEPDWGLYTRCDNGTQDCSNLDVEGGTVHVRKGPALTAPRGAGQGYQALDHAPGNFYAHAVSGGDVDGDGRSDLLVGAPGSGAEAGEIVLRTRFGAESPERDTFLRDDFVRGTRPGDRVGMAVDSAGDVDGDGLADVVVGSERGCAVVYGAPEFDELALSASDFSTPEGIGGECWTARGGDVNGDGLGDVLQLVDGKVFVIPGRQDGLRPSDVDAMLSTAGSHAAKYARAIGDVNGDGYADLIVGVRIAWGNHARGLDLRPRQLTAGGPGVARRRIARGARSDRHDAFALSAIGRTPWGRGDVRLEWEVKPAGTRLDGTGLQRSDVWHDSRRYGVTLTELVDGLAQDTRYHWRLRFLYNPATTPFQPHGRWFTIPSGGWQEAMLRTAAE